MPHGVKVVYPYDTTPFVKLSIENVVWTLVEAVCLVFVVMFIFLGRASGRRSFRRSPCRSSCSALSASSTTAGYSINTLTMFAMVLAIGLLVDDAMLSSKTSTWMSEEGLSPREATLNPWAKAMRFANLLQPVACSLDESFKRCLPLPRDWRGRAARWRALSYYGRTNPTLRFSITTS